MLKTLRSSLILVILMTAPIFGFLKAHANETVDTTLTMDNLVCNVLGFLTGKVGKALAAFACMGVSLAFLGGKVSWTMILTFSLGMACIFGAPTIIKAFTGGNDVACSGSESTGG
jgi:type IV secretory pathway VirB2 component (pilin)